MRTVRACTHYGGLALAVSFGMIEPPFGVFIATVPFLKMLNRPKASHPVRLFSQLVDGASQPVGGDGDHSIRLANADTPSAGATGIGAEARDSQIVRKAVLRGVASYKRARRFTLQTA